MFIIPENMEIMMEFPISDSSEKAVEPKELITRKTEFTIKINRYRKALTTLWWGVL